MKKIINGKKYDTETAEKVGSDSYNGSPRDFEYWSEELYRKRTGEFFLYGEGGASSKYAEARGQSGWYGGGEKIIPLEYKEAVEWAEKHLTTDEYEELFGAVSEEDGNTVLSVSMPTSVAELIRRTAAMEGKHVSQLITEVCRTYCEAKGKED